jgi:phosphatidylglycerol:prolipoprotein diacylglycerol transferase
MGVSVDPNLPVHPTFLYESLWNLCVFLFLIWFRKRKKLDGEVFSMYMVLYGAGRFWIEGLRTDSLMLGNLRVSQVLAALCVVAFAITMLIRRKKAAEAVEDAETGTSIYGDILKELNEEEESAAEDGAAALNAGKAAVAEGIKPLCGAEEKTLKESDDAKESAAVAGDGIINAENMEG